MQVRDRVLAMSMDQSVSQELTHRSCSQCGASTYDASLTCHSCQNNSEACCISGQAQKLACLVFMGVARGCLCSKAKMEGANLRSMVVHASYIHCHVALQGSRERRQAQRFPFNASV